MNMAIMYNEKKKEYEGKGFLPFVLIVKWRPEEEPVAIERYSKIYERKEGENLKGVHTWNLIGRNTMIVIGWTKSHISLQRLCTSITYATGISLDVCPAIDHDDLSMALQQLKSELTVA
jgi:hypothetical protein